MGNLARSYVKLLPVIALFFSLLSGSVIGLSLHSQLGKLADQQGHQLSQTLAQQLAKAVRDPLIHRDNLSLQVELDELLSIAGVQRAAIYDVNQRLIAQTQREQTGTDGAYEQRSQVSIESASVGYATVSLQPAYMTDSFSRPLLTFATIWAVFTALLILLAYRLGASLSGRIGQLIRQLPGEEDNGLDELSTLRQRMEPLLAIPDSPPPALRQQPVALLGIACRNLPRLETLLNREHFESLMGRFDQLIERTLKLYGGERLHGDHYNVYLEFRGADDADDQTMNAAYCAAALLRLSAKLLNNGGVTVDLAAAVSPTIRQCTGSTLLNELEQGQHLNSLRELLEKATDGEILLNQAACQHPSLAEFELAPLAEDSPLCRINHFGEDGENLLSRQLALLSHH
ncbi:hypothetical protein [Porticoccus sp.]